MNHVNTCLVSQDIEVLIQSGSLLNADTSKVQPSSYDAVIGHEAYVLDVDSGLFRPEAGKSVRSTLLEMSCLRRQKISLEVGAELKRGFSYLIPLREKLSLGDGVEAVRSSPKSSMGRLFVNTRLLADYQSSFDEINNLHEGKTLELWLLVQPLAFDLIVYPGLSFNQLRFFRSYDAKLSHSEMVDEIKNNPLLYRMQGNGALVPANPVIADGLTICLNIDGSTSGGIVALRARKNPIPIDLHKTEFYRTEDYFEPVICVNGKKELVIVPGEFYLVSSRELLIVPEHLAIELRDHSSLAFRGPLHFAGFVDNGFRGDLVFEVRSDEITPVKIRDGDPVSKLDLFRTPFPSKVYGESIGSNYYGQHGPRPSKFFLPFDYEHAGKRYNLLARDVLVADKQLVLDRLGIGSGMKFFGPGDLLTCLNLINGGFFQSRYDCEDDPLLLQFIPYLVLFGPNRTVFVYTRAKDIIKYGEPQLFGKKSFGLSGHIAKEHGPNYIDTCLQEKVLSEVVINGALLSRMWLGALFTDESTVDRKHLGLIHAAYVAGDVKDSVSAITNSGFVNIKELVSNSELLSEYENWSKTLIAYLERMYDIVKCE